MLGWEPECRRHYANDRERLVADPDRTADDIRMAAKLRAPQVIADDDDVLRPGTLVLGAQDAPYRRGRAQDLERRGRCFDRCHRATGAANVESDARWPVRRERVEGPQRRPPQKVVAGGGMFVDGVAPVAHRSDATLWISR